MTAREDGMTFHRIHIPVLQDLNEGAAPTRAERATDRKTAVRTVADTLNFTDNNPFGHVQKSVGA